MRKRTLWEAFGNEFLEGTIEFDTLIRAFGQDLREGDFPFSELSEDDPFWEPPEKGESQPQPPQQPPQEKKKYTYRTHFNRGVLWTDYQKNLLKKFMPFVIKELKIKNPVEIYLINKRKGEMTTAAFEVDSEKMYILAKNRHHVDIFRSIAHEMVHLRQKDKNEDVKKKKNIPDIGGKIEDEANAVAGQIIKKFALKVGKKSLYDVIGDEKKFRDDDYE